MADDLIGALTSRVRELSLRVATLESELDGAQRRVRVYEQFDHTVQEAIASALRSAFEIREQAEHTASAIVDDAKAQRSAILTELEQLRAERERVQREVAEARVTRDAVHQPPPAVSAAQLPLSEMRLAASEALRGVFKELVDEIRNAPPAARAPQAPPAQPVPQASPAWHAPEPQAAQPFRPTPAPMPRVVDPVPPPPQPRIELPPRFEPPPPESAPLADLPPARVDPVAVDSPRSIARAAIEDVEEAPVRYTPSEPSSEVQLVLSPIPSFPRLVEIERRIQSLPVVRTLYVRDFRGGVATLAVGLRQPMASSEFATALGGLEHPRLRVVSSTRNVLELRIDGESAIA
ncbi:MAG: hypothetical protein NVS9B6_09570 [Candidatus Limnocylindrales bacterium]